MRKIVLIGVAAVMLGGCQTVRDRNIATGAVIGGTTGAIIGGVATRTTTGAVVGGAIGTVTGGIIGSALTPSEPCYVRTRRGKLRRVAC